MFHLEFLEYKHYDFEVTFRHLESVHQKYGISDVRFSFQSVNSSFTTLTIWFRFVFLASAFAVTVSQLSASRRLTPAHSLLSNEVILSRATLLPFLAHSFPLSLSPTLDRLCPSFPVASSLSPSTIT